MKMITNDKIRNFNMKDKNSKINNYNLKIIT